MKFEPFNLFIERKVVRSSESISKVRLVEWSMFVTVVIVIVAKFEFIIDIIQIKFMFICLAE